MCHKSLICNGVNLFGLGETAAFVAVIAAILIKWNFHIRLNKITVMGETEAQVANI